MSTGMAVRDETPDEAALYERLLSQARQIVTCVKEGKLKLDRSSVVEDHLFVATNDGYLVFPPEGNIGESNTASVENVNWQVAIHEDTLRNLGVAFTKWLSA